MQLLVALSARAALAISMLLATLAFVLLVAAAEARSGLLLESTDAPPYSDVAE